MGIGQITKDHIIIAGDPGQGIDPSPDALAFAELYHNTGFTEAHGDIWANVDHESSSYSGINLWDVDGSATDPIVAGEYTWTVIHQEIAHALGIDIVGSTLESTAFNSHKYSVTSYNFHPDMYYDPNDGTGAHASGLQLLDIAALQEIYGANTTTRLGDTTYGIGQGFGATASDAFVYTIWDAGGTADEIDASGFNVRAEVATAGYCG